LNRSPYTLLKQVLDVATGRGAVLFPLAKAVGPLGKVVGIDISRQMVKEPHRNSPKKIFLGLSFNGWMQNT